MPVHKPERGCVAGGLIDVDRSNGGADASVILHARIDRCGYSKSGPPALENVDLAVRRGDYIVITGPAGCGKTTLVQCLAGVIPKSVPARFEGQVRIHGVDVSELPLPKISPLLGMVMQVPDNQLFSVTVGEDVAFGPENLNLEISEIHERAQSAMRFTGTLDLAERFSHLLSGGQSQRVVLASVLALGTEIYVLDQPAAELDPVGRRMIYDNLRRLNEDGKTIIVIEDRLSDVAEHASRIVLLDDGHVVRDLDPHSFLADEGVADYGVRIPDSVEVSRALRSRGLPLKRTPLSPRELSEDLRPFLSALDDDTPPPEAPAVVAADDRVPIVEISGLVHRYGTGVEALAGVDLAVPAGDFVAIVGANGAGKTTLAKHLIGLLRPSHGSVRLLGGDTAGTPVHQLSRTVGFLFQDPDLQIFNDSCVTEVCFGLRLRKLPDELVSATGMRALERVGLVHLAQEHPYSLSRGERQRLALASILALEPPLLVVDEPSTGLDYRETLLVMRLLEEFRTGGGTVIIITHDMEMAVRFARRIVVMQAGTIVHDLPTAEVFEHLEGLKDTAILLPDSAEIARSLELGRSVLTHGQLTQALIHRIAELRAGESCSANPTHERCLG